MAYPRFVEFHEEGPREGFQSEKTLYPLASRVALVDALTATGLKKIQVASFVNPRMVPAMADAAELFGAIRKNPACGIRRCGSTPRASRRRRPPPAWTWTAR